MTGHLLGGRYTLLSHIAQGGMGEVWKARDRVSGRTVAAKVLRPELSGQELSLSRLRLEARNAMSVEHPNIANVLDSGEENGRGWIIMELVEGRPLTDYLRGNSVIAPEYLMPVLMQIAMALGAAAQAGVVHRDIKPANVLVREDGMVKLTDFGISRTDSQVELTAAGMVMGTAQYLPPEQAMGEKATSLGDLYALGVIAYEAASGRRPFTGESQVDIAFSHVNDPVPPLPSTVPAPLADVIMHLLEKTPSQRPESGAALVRELVAAGQALGISLSPRPLPLPEGVADQPETAAQPAVPPVRHTPQRSLPDEMLAPVDVEERASRPSLSSRTRIPQPRSERHLPTWHRMGSDEAPAASAATATSAPASPPPSVSAPAPTGKAPSLPARPSSSRHEAPAHSASSHREATSRTSPTHAAAPRRNERDAQSPSEHAHAVEERREAVSSSTRRFPWREIREDIRLPLTAPTVRSKYNRSVVAPQPTRGETIGKWVVITLIVLTLILIALATIQNRFGMFTSASEAYVPLNEEVTTWLSPSLIF